jgi:signal transduction histidine kinase
VLEDMIGEADQLIKVFNALLLISRVEAGFSKQKLDEVDLAVIAGEVAELYEPLVEDAGMCWSTRSRDRCRSRASAS